MNVLVIPNNMVNNCFGVRNKLPMEHLSKLGHEIRFTTELAVYNHPKLGKVLDSSSFDWADVVVFNRHYDLALPNIRNIFEYCKQNGKRVVYETDDLLEAIDEHNPANGISKDHGGQIRYMIKNADICTTTTENLKKELERYSKNVVVLPNCIDTKTWKERKGGNKKVRVGWAGGSSHAKDMMIIIEVIKQLQKEIDFEFVIFGLSDSPWKKHVKHLKERHEEQLVGRPGAKPAPWYSAFMEVDSALKDVKFKHYPFVSHSEYNQKLASVNLDIGLCPLQDTRFNRSKSAIKFYEYAMVGTSCLASNIPPYADEVGYVTKNKFSDWYSKLKQLILDAELRENLVNSQRKWVIENRSIESNVQGWSDAYFL